MEQIILPNVTESVINERCSKFTVSPLFPGYGHTLGNSIRRVLLSSLPGAAVTSFRVDGLDHEFSTVPGVKEDAVEIMLNLKTLSVTMHETDEPVLLQLSVKGPLDVTAAHFAANSKVSIANPDLHIATLAAKSTLNLEVKVEYGRGYDAVEKRENKYKTLGEIAIDSLFSPVTGVSLEVENTRVGKMTNYDKLELTITTNGTVVPSAAFKAASLIMVDQFNLLANYDQIVAENVVESTEVPTESSVDLLSLGLSTKAIKTLGSNGITELAQLNALTEEQLLAIDGLTKKTVSDILKTRAE